MNFEEKEELYRWMIQDETPTKISEINEDSDKSYKDNYHPVVLF